MKTPPTPNIRFPVAVRKCLKCRRAFKCVFDTRWNVPGLPTQAQFFLEFFHCLMPLSFHLPLASRGAKFFAPFPSDNFCAAAVFLISDWTFLLTELSVAWACTPIQLALVFLSGWEQSTEWICTKQMCYSPYPASHFQPESTAIVFGKCLFLYFCQTARRNCLALTSPCPSPSPSRSPQFHFEALPKIKVRPFWETQLWQWKTRVEAVYVWLFYANKFNHLSLNQTNCSGRIPQTPRHAARYPPLYSDGSSSIFVHSTFNLFPESAPALPSTAVIYPFAAVTICNTHPAWWVRRRSGPVWPAHRFRCVYGRIGCQLAGQSVTQSTRSPSPSPNPKNEFVLCLPKGFSIESVKYHNLQSNQKLCSTSSFFSSPLSLSDVAYVDAEDDETTTRRTRMWQQTNWQWTTLTSNVQIDTRTETQRQRVTSGRINHSLGCQPSIFHIFNLFLQFIPTAPSQK